MILKEIEMDLPYVADDNQEHLSAEDMKMDYELNWKQKRRQFQLMTRCMTSMVERMLPRIITKDCWKILIECVEKLPRRECINLLGVYSVQVLFDINMFYEMDTLEKKQYIVNKIKEAMNKLSEYNLFDVEEIYKVCNEVVDSNYINEWFWNKPVKMKHVSVQIKVLHDIENVSIYMVFKNSIKKKYEEKFLVADIPDERVYSRYLGKLEWISVGIARLSTKNGECFIEKYE